MNKQFNTPILSRLNRQKIAKNAVSTGLCLAMCISLAGCGGSTGKATKAAETIAADAAYFSSKSLDFYVPKEGEDCYVQSVTPCGDKVAVLLNVNYYPDNGEGGGGVIVYGKGSAVAETVAAETVADETVAPDETAAPDVTMAPDVTVAPDETAAGEGDSDTQAADTEMFVDETASAGDLSNGYNKFYVLLYNTAGELESTTDISASVDANGYVMTISADTDGNLVLIVNTYDMETGASIFELVTLGADGKTTGEPKILTFDEMFYPNTMIFGNDGNMYFSGYKDTGCIVVTDKDGKQLFEISNASINGSLYKVGDQIYCDGYDEKDNYKHKFYEVLASSKKLGDAIDMSAFNNGGIYSGLDGLYMSDSYGVYKVDLKANLKTDVFSFDQTDALTNSYNASNQYYVLTNDKLLMISTEYSMGTGASTTTATLLSRETANPNAGKEIIVLGGVGLIYNSKISEAVYNFNKESTEYRIEIRDYEKDVDYSNAETNEDYMKIQADMYSAMNLDILNGTGPDIVYGVYENTSSLEAKGLFVDMYALMEKDTEFKKDDYLPSVFKMCETDGKLYKIPTSFMIYGLAGAKSVIGDRTGWTMDEFNQVVNSLPKDMEMMSMDSSMTQSSLLTYILYGNMNSLINYKSGEVSFDSDAFRQLMEFAKTYGSDDDAISDDGGEWVDPMERVRNGEVAMVNSYIYGANSYNEMVTVFGEPVSVVGYPSANASGPLCALTNSFAISSESANIDASWSFIKSLLSKDAQTPVDMYSYEIPVLKSAFEAQIETAMNPPKDSNNKDSNNMYYSSYTADGMLPAMTEESAQAYRALVDSLDSIMIMDNAVNSIILEEVPAYFNDQKSDKDVSALIQNRVETLVRERG